MTAVAIAPDGTWLATASDDGTARIWDAATGAARATLTGHTDRGDGGGDRPGRHLARHRQRRRDGADLGRCHRRSNAPPSPATPAGWTAVAIAPDGTWLATASNDRTVRIWDAATGQQRGCPHRPYRLGDGGGDRAGRHLARHRQRRRDGADLGRCDRPADAPPSPATPTYVTAVAIAPDGTWLATAS